MEGSPAERAEVWRDLFTAMVRIFNQVEGDLKRDADLTLIDIGCLFALSVADARGRSMGSLARLWGVDASVITYRARRLENQGLIDRGGQPVNHRYVHLRITEAGRGTLKVARQRLLASADARFFDFLGDGDLEHLRTLVAHLDASRQYSPEHPQQRAGDP